MHTIASVLPALVAALNAHGVDSDAVFRAAGVRVVPASNPLARIDVVTIQRLWDAAFAATGDETIGLDTGKHFHPASWHALGLALEASNNLVDFCERLGRFFHFVAPTAEFTCEREQGHFVLQGNRRMPHVPYFSEDATTAFLTQWIDELSDGRCQPVSVGMMRPAPCADLQRFRAHFPCPLSFGGTSLRFTFSDSVTELAWSARSEELATHNEQLVVAYLSMLEEGDIVSRVRELLVRSLGVKSVNKAVIARNLNLSSSTMQQRLAAQGSSFSQLLDEVRHSRARAMLENSTVPVKSIAYALGFSTTSNFDRAFKHWSGQTPNAYRRSLQQSNASDHPN